MHNRLERPSIGFNIVAYGLISFLAIIGFLPFWLLVSGSFTDNTTIVRYGYRLWPKVFSLEAYRMAFRIPEMIFRSYTVTICITAIGTLLVLFFCSMTAFALSRQDFRYRNWFAFFFYFPSLFSGGMMPYYILMLNLGMVNNYLALILPCIMNFFYIVVLRSFFKMLPAEIGESGKIDGANDLVICYRLYIPMAMPALATIGLFSALNYWNSWRDAMLFIREPKMYPLQYQLYRILNNAQWQNQVAAREGIQIQSVPTEAYKLAMVCLAIGPIFLLFPYIQKYFIKGLTIGAVKG